MSDSPEREGRVKSMHAGDMPGSGAQASESAMMPEVAELLNKLREQQRKTAHLAELHRRERLAREAAEAAMRRQAEVCQQSEDRYRDLLQQSSEGIYRVELERPVSLDTPEEQQIENLMQHAYIAECNEAMARMYGYTSPGELVGRRVGELLDRNDLHTYEYLRAAIRSRYHLVDAESHEVDRDGGRKYFMNNFLGVVEDNHLLRVWGTQRDITQQRRVEEALRVSEEKFRIMADSAPVMIWIAGPDKQCVWLNRRWLEFVGRRLEQETGQGWAEHLHPEDGARAMETYFSAFDARKVFTMEYRMRRHDGQYRWVIDTGVPLYGVRGEFLGYIGSCIDITERKQAEEERSDLLHREQRARAEAEAANRRKDQFLAVLSHEMRTPLTPVLARLTLLKREKNLSPEMESALDMIRRNVELEARLIDDLLDLTKIATGKVQLMLQIVDAHKELRDALSIYEKEIAQKDLHVTVYLQAGEHRVKADPVRLEQVFWNLISNAVKYTPSGRHITIRSMNQGPLLRVEIADDGIGIEPEVMSRLFNAFEQGEQTLSRRFGGLGLGLSISKSLMELQGGKLSAVSAGKDKGATFAVEMPFLPQEVAGARAPAAGLGAPKRALSILLVEDSEDTLRVLSRFLRGSGHQVKTATTSQAALQIAEAEPFDLIICDIGLPDGTGWDLIRKVRSRRPMKAIALSGFASDEDAERSKAAGFQRHLAKPIIPEKLEGVIQEVASEGAA
ncbi:MAG: PAS domain S-box protein [Bacillota bacterium]